MDKATQTRIAKNTAMLYVRMLLRTLLSLFIVRYLLLALGQEDFGLFNVVAGFIAVFQAISATMTNACQRFFSYELGRSRKDRLRLMVGVSLLIFLIISVLIFFLAYLVGDWFIENKLNAASELIPSYKFIYLLSLITFVLSLFAVPYTALLIAFEDMKAFSAISLLETFLKLGAVLLLFYFTEARMLVYSWLLLLISLVSTIFYIVYCLRKYSVARTFLHYDSDCFREMMSFTGWNFFTTIAWTCNTQVMNMLLNIFFGLVVNAARAIAFQVFNTVLSFGTNFITALRPNLVRLFSVGQIHEFRHFTVVSSKYAFLLMFAFCNVLLFNIDGIFSFWLGDIPEHTVLFTQLMLVNLLIESMSFVLNDSIMATGDIRNYQLITGVILILNLPISYLLFSRGLPPEVFLYVLNILSAVSLLSKLFILKRLVSLEITVFFKKALLPSVLTLLFSWLCCFMWVEYFNYNFFFNVLVTLFLSSASIYWIGLDSTERRVISRYMRAKLDLLKRHWKPDFKGIK